VSEGQNDPILVVFLLAHSMRRRLSDSHSVTIVPMFMAIRDRKTQRLSLL
jgi:hypothetical protein